LLDLCIEEEKVKEIFPALWEYLQFGREKGLHQRYLCANRPMWYLQERRPPAPIICTYMARSVVPNQPPFRFILNNSNATITNGFLALYPQPRFENFMNKNKDAILKAWQALNQVSIENILHEGRVYGGGLHKLEPKELANVHLPELDEIFGHLAQAKQLKMSLNAVAS